MFCYQKSTKSRSAAPCSREVFWNAIKDPSTKWRVDARRAIIAAVERSEGEEGAMALTVWLQNNDYQRFLVEHPRELSSDTAREAWQQKSDAEKLLAFADHLKQSLTPFVFSCYEFDKHGIYCPRQLRFCHLNGLVMHDYDHLENPMRVWYELRDNQALMARTAFVHITSSGYGIRIITTADSSVGNLADNQIEFANALGCQPDDSCIDATRNSFAPKEEDILYINEDLLFDHYDEDFDRRFTPEYREKRTQPLHHQFPAVDEKAKGVQGNQILPLNRGSQRGSDDGHVDTTWCDASIQPIIDYWTDRRFGDNHERRTSRHDASVSLARDLYIMYDRDKRKTLTTLMAQPWVQEIIRERDEDVERTVSDAADYVAAQESEAAKNGKPWLPKPSKEMQEAIKEVHGRSWKEIIEGGGDYQEKTGDKSSAINGMLKQWGEEIEALFPDFPMLKDVCYGLKKSQYPAALFVGGGTMMTLMTRCWYRFYHRPQQERRLNCSLFIIGHPASNKSMADDIYETFSAPIVAADRAGLAALNRYKQDTKKKAANKEGKDKPQGIIRIHPARTSNGQLIQDMLNARETIEGKEIQLHMMTFDTELDNSITLQQGGSWINKQTMELKAFHNEKDGQMYQNSDSPVDEFNVTWNFIYTGTPIALKKKVNERNFGSGLSTRLAVIPMPKTNFEMIPFEDKDNIDWNRIDRMKEWAFRLDARYGELPLWGLVRKIYDWTADRMEECAEDESESNELMLKRVAYHALNYAAPFIDMRHWDSMQKQGNYWTGEYETDDKDWKLCELTARIQYATQKYFFGALAEKYFDDMNSDVQFSGVRHQQRSVSGYNQLPMVFTKEEAAKCFGLKKDNSVNKRLRRLQRCQYIELITGGEDDGKYRKCIKSLY